MLKVKILRMLAIVNLAAAVITSNLWCAMIAVALSGLSAGMRIVWRKEHGRK